MASNRHLGRIIALQTLYEEDFRVGSGDAEFDVKAVLDRNINRYHGQIDDRKFVERLVDGVLKHKLSLDKELQPVAPEWPLEQIARIDRTILRLGWYELKYEQDVPPKVVINEAVELAKAYGAENSSRFINGVLGTLLETQTSTKSATDLPQNKQSAQPAKKVSPKSGKSGKTGQKSVKVRHRSD